MIVDIITNNEWFRVDHPTSILSGFSSSQQLHDVGLILNRTGATSRLNVRAAMLNAIITELPSLDTDIHSALSAASTIHNGVYAYINVLDSDSQSKAIEILDPQLHRCDDVVVAAVASVIPVTIMMQWIVSHTSITDAVRIPERLANFTVIQATVIVRGLIDLFLKLQNDIRSNPYEKMLISTALIEALFYIEDVNIQQFSSVIKAVPYKQLYPHVTSGTYEWLRDAAS